MATPATLADRPYAPARPALKQDQDRAKSAKLAIGVATAGRREVVTRLLEELALQTRLPDCVFLGPASADDVDEAAAAATPFPTRIVHGDRGAATQRNTILEASRDFDVVLFIDDDFIPAPDYIARCLEVLSQTPSIAILTGTVIADGAQSAGLDIDEAMEILRADKPPATDQLSVTYGGYGCNMAVVTKPVYEHNIRFDDALPLYSWLEDIDFSRRVAPYGDIVRTLVCRGVHMGVKRGRTSGVRFGYSQIANPIHMVRKGSLSKRYAYSMISSNVMANLARSLAPEPWVDRKGRVWGNLLAAFDLVLGRLDPRRILSFK